jgi:hypothetical protein
MEKIYTNDTFDKMNTAEIHSLLGAIAGLLSQCEETKSRMAPTTGEVKEAYKTILHDQFWKLQKTVGQLWYYMCGSDSVSIEQIKKNIL